MPDVVVPLYHLDSAIEVPEGVTVRRAMAYERAQVLRFVESHFHDRWASEVAVSFGGHPIGCFIAIRARSICGFACSDATFRGFFGPLGVRPTDRGQGVGEALLKSTLKAMQELGYAYAIVGGASDALSFYERTVGGQIISGSEPGPYRHELEPQDSSPV